MWHVRFMKIVRTGKTARMRNAHMEAIIASTGILTAEATITVARDMDMAEATAKTGDTTGHGKGRTNAE